MTTLILGSGIFGASTALHLIRKHPSHRITLIDRDHYAAPTRVAASWDWNKVVRSDYSDPFYTRLGLEAQQLWRSDPIWREFYHESGVVWVSPSDFAKKVVKNFEEVGEQVDLSVVGVDEARKIYGGLFDGADYTGVKEVLVNRGSGWAEAKEALQGTIQEAVNLGVSYVTGEVEAVNFEDDGRRCTGVMMKDGTVMEAERVVLCTGACTPKLLVDSAPERREFHADGRIMAVAVTEGTAPLNEEQRAVLETMPVGINENPTERGLDVGCLPLPKMGALKCWGQVLFRNTVDHPLTQQPLSTPPAGPNYNQWDVPSELKEDVRWALRSLFHEGRFDTEMENFRICWDAVTPSNDFIVSPHPASDGLYVATCGSFHGFKFLPVIGKYVVEMLDGELDPATAKRWAWDRQLPPTENNKKWSQRELKDFA
ncbi:hypothetical protein OQA88_8955 [Cercophora sp. LCS_1]